MTESEVIDAVSHHLKAHGWRIERQVAKTERHADIVAVHCQRNVRAFVHVKGKGGMIGWKRRFARPFTSAEVAGYVSQALFNAMSATQQRGLSAIAFPKSNALVERIDRVRKALRQLKMEVFWVSPDGTVEAEGHWHLDRKDATEGGGESDRRSVVPSTASAADLPSTLEAAVDRLMGQLSDDAKANLIAMDERRLAGLHFDLGLTIRNQFALWSPDTPLRIAMGASNGDDASAVIIRALWWRLRKEVLLAGNRAGPKSNGMSFLKRQYPEELEILKRLYGSDEIEDRLPWLNEIFQSTENTWQQYAARFRNREVKYLLIGEAPPWCEEGPPKYVLDPRSPSRTLLNALRTAFFGRGEGKLPQEAWLGLLNREGWLIVDSIPFPLNYQGKRNRRDYRDLVSRTARAYLEPKLSQSLLTWSKDVRVAFGVKRNALAVMAALGHELRLGSTTVRLGPDLIAVNKAGYPDAQELKRLYGLPS